MSLEALTNYFVNRSNAAKNAVNVEVTGSLPLYNGTTYDAMRNNVEGTLLASAARTSTTASPQQTNHNAKGVMVTLNVTAASGAGGLTLYVRAINPVTGVSSGGLNNAPTAVTANGIYRYIVYPGASGGSVTQATSLPLPRVWDININHGDSSSYTYSVSYQLIL